MRCALVVALCLAAIPAQAHQLGVTYLNLTEDGHELAVEIAIDPHDTPLSTHIDSDGDGAISRLELEAGSAALEAFTFGRLRVSTPSGACVRDTVNAVANDLGVWQARADYRCPALSSEARIDVGFLAAMPNGHRAIARIRHGDQLAQQLLDAHTTVIEAREQKWLRQAWRFLRLGLWHILSGLDHLAFVLALVLAASRMTTVPRPLRNLVVVLSAFTVAHAITLMLAGLDLVHLPARAVETTIALSIAVAAADAWAGCNRLRVRVALVFAFGLVHGLGFADILGAAQLRGAMLVSALLCFNFGIELGQLALVALTWPLLQRLPDAVRRSLAIVLFAVGLGWAGLRALS